MFSKKINLTAYTLDKNIYDFCKPVYKSKAKPSWLEQLKSVIVTWDDRTQMPAKSGTLLTCPGVRDFLSTPIQVPMWGDIDILIKPDGSWTYNTRPEWGLTVTHHNEAQFKGAYNNRLALKLSNPWIFKTDSKINFMVTESHYSTSYFRDLGVLFSPGVTNYYKQHSLNVHLNCPIKDEAYIINLKHGMPLISIFPMTEREIEFDSQLVSIEEWNNISNHFPYTFVGRYFKKD